MAIADDFRDYLLTKAGVTALVGSRIVFGQSHYVDNTPRVVFRTNTSRDHITQRGNTGMKTTILQVDCYAQDGEKAMALLEQVRQSVSARRGTMGDSTNVVSFYRNASADKLTPLDGADQGVGRAVCEVELKHYVTVPVHS